MYFVLIQDSIELWDCMQVGDFNSSQGGYTIRANWVCGSVRANGVRLPKLGGGPNRFSLAFHLSLLNVV